MEKLLHVYSLFSFLLRLIFVCYVRLLKHINRIGDIVCSKHEDFASSILKCRCCWKTIESQRDRFFPPDYYNTITYTTRLQVAVLFFRSLCNVLRKENLSLVHSSIPYTMLLSFTATFFFCTGKRYTVIAIANICLAFSSKRVLNKLTFGSYRT